MPFLGEIIRHIDQHLSAGVFNYERFQGGRFAGMAWQVPTRKPGEENKDRLFYIPAVVTNLGEYSHVIPDDNYPIITYHRVLSNTYGVAEQRRQFGDGNKLVVNSTDVLFTVIAFTKRVNMSSDQIEALIMSDFPDELKSPVFEMPEGVFQVTIQPAGSSFDSVALFSQEYRGEVYFLKPESVLFQIRYRIEAVFKKGCFTICDDC